MLLHTAPLPTTAIRPGDILVEVGVNYLSFDTVSKVTNTEDGIALTSTAYTLWADGTSNNDLFVVTWLHSEDTTHQVIRF